MANRVPIETGEWYHCFNRGVDRRKIFADKRDYERFMLLMLLCSQKDARRPANVRKAGLAGALKDGRSPVLRVQLGAYCLMPNHVHFILKEVEPGGIASFMQKLFTGYTMYFNKRHGRAGALFSGTYKSKHLATDRYFKHAINYVHMNPIQLFEPSWKEGSGNLGSVAEALLAYRYSSLPDHLNLERPENGILGKEVFTLFNSPQSLSPILFDAQAYHRETGGAL